MLLDEINFLPDAYRQKARRRQDQAWRGLFAAAFVIGIGATAVYQQHLKSQANAEFQSWEAPFLAATAQNARLAAINASLKTERTQAQLFTTFRTPWPRSQLLSAIAANMSDNIVLLEVRIESAVEESSTAAQVASSPPPKPESPDAVKPSPLEKDLLYAREQDDKLRSVVYISGETRETSELHIFLAKLASHPLFSKAQITSLESLSGDTSTGSRFTAALIVQPAYGQPGGPKPPVEKTPEQKTAAETAVATPMGAPS